MNTNKEKQYFNWQKDYSDFCNRKIEDSNSPIIGITGNFGEYGCQLAYAYYESIRRAGGIPLIIPPSYELDGLAELVRMFDAIVFSGGGDLHPAFMGKELIEDTSECNIRDKQELLLMKLALNRQIPILGICRGMQLLSIVSGGSLIQDIPTDSEFGPKALEHSQKSERFCTSHIINIEEDSILYSLFNKTKLDVNSFHHQAVATVGDNLKIIAKSPDGIIEAIESAEHKSILGVQWHPEAFITIDNEEMMPIFNWLIDVAKEYKEAKRLHREMVTLDSHCDTPMFFHEDIHFENRDSRILVDSHKMREGMLDASFMVAYIPQKELDAKSLKAATSLTNSLLDGIEQRIATCPGVKIAYTPNDIITNKRNGLLSIVKGIENGYAIGDDINNLKHFRNRGVVYMTLCHNGDNLICDSASKTQNSNGGVSEFGEKVIKEMNKLGMMVDLSHGGKQSFYNALEISSLPIVCTHASVRSLCNHPRNLDDEQMKALAKVGGVMQITLYPYFLRSDGKATILDAIEHLNYAVKIMGIDHVGLGTDFDGDGGVPGLADASELLNFTRQLIRNRYSEEDITKIWGGNFMRVMNQVQQA
ncbi:MAG: gamma-glutamyl-gamma-aminobutyrate hydrolase family protein [Prevotellaceae bacterium]|nr:gamma-glutamyl-gamma-aminobutyrate hydrolase family protein [Candidatus Faecinaster equi]